MQYDPSTRTIIGTTGSLAVPADDKALEKLAMLIEGECEGLGPTVAAAKYGFSRQRYFQLRAAFAEGGLFALCNRKPGPKQPSRRTPAATREVIRHRFLDPDASAEVIAQKIRQTGLLISTRSVTRVLDDFGLQKKTL